MKQSNSSDSNRFSASQEIPHILYTQKADESKLREIFLLRMPDPEDWELRSSKTLVNCLPVDMIKHPKT
jgi:hypothetical protein